VFHTVYFDGTLPDRIITVQTSANETRYVLLQTVFHLFRINRPNQAVHCSVDRRVGIEQIGDNSAQHKLESKVHSLR